MGSITEFFTDELPEVPRRVPIEETYRKTEDALEKAKEFLDKCSCGILALHSIAGSSRQEFKDARTKLTDLARIYTSLHFPLSVSVVRDVRDVFNMYAGYDIKKLKKKTLAAMEKTITEHATNSADSSRVHGALLSDLESLRIDLRKKSETLKNDARKWNETCKKLRQEIEEKKVQYISEHNDCIARKEEHSKKKWEHDVETAKAAALALMLKASETAHEKDACEAKMKKENAARQSTFSSRVATVGAVTVLGTVGAAAVVGTGGIVGLVGTGAGVALFGLGAGSSYTAKAEERKAEGVERAAISERNRATNAVIIATEEKERARMSAQEADQLMRKADRDAAEVAANAARDESHLKNKANIAKEGAEACDIAIQSLSSVVDPLQQFVKAMETVSQFLSFLASDINVCLGQVKAGKKNGMQRMNHHFELMQTYIGRVTSRCDNFENFQVVVQARIHALPGPLAPDAPPSSVSWIQRHQDSGSLSQPQSQRIRERLHLDLQRPSLWYHIIPGIGVFRRNKRSI